MLQLNDVADYLGKKYGAMDRSAAAVTCKQGDNWLGIPVATVGGYMTYRKSSVEKAGFKDFPKDFPGFPNGQAPKATRRRPAFRWYASGDANAWLHWILWGPRRLHRRQGQQGHHQLGREREGTRVSKALVRHLHSRRRVLERFLPNNKAYLSGELHCTANGISIYVAAKDDPNKKELTEDTYHALWPVGPIGKPTEEYAFWRGQPRQRATARPRLHRK